MTNVSVDYDIVKVDGKDLVDQLHWTQGGDKNGDTCTAVLNPDDSGTYIFESNLGNDDTPVMAPNPMTLADCVLAANVHMGLIPPQNFESVPCENQH